MLCIMARLCYDGNIQKFQRQQQQFELLRILGSIVIFCIVVPSFWPLFFHGPRDVSNSCLLPLWKVVRDLIFCLVIPWDLWMKRTIKIQDVFWRGGGGFQNWPLSRSHPLGYWIPFLCNVEKVVGENLPF